MINIPMYSGEAEHVNGHQFLECSNTMKSHIKPRLPQGGAIGQSGKNDLIAGIGRIKLNQGTL